MTHLLGPPSHLWQEVNNIWLLWLPSNQTIHNPLLECLICCVPENTGYYAFVPCSLYEWRRGKLSIFYISKQRLAAVATELNDAFGCKCYGWQEGPSVNGKLWHTTIAPSSIDYIANIQGHSHRTVGPVSTRSLFEATTTFLPIFMNLVVCPADWLAAMWPQLTELEIEGYKIIVWKQQFLISKHEVATRAHPDNSKMKVNFFPR